MDIRYTIEFFSYWHCGSGLSAGADLDSLVVKDSNGMPFVPGKTVKGLIREAAETLIEVCPAKYPSKTEVDSVFGIVPDGIDVKDSGCAFFSNAEFPDSDYERIVGSSKQEYLFDAVSYTAIGGDGIALPHSLRRVEVVVPCTLTGVIKNLPSGAGMQTLVIDSFAFIKRLGENRNRGLGRCEFKKFSQKD